LGEGPGLGHDLKSAICVDPFSKAHTVTDFCTDGGTRKKSTLVVGALLASALALGGCSISMTDRPLVGTRADAPDRPKEAGAYLPVHDLPPDREESALAPAERAKIEGELIAARDRVSATAAKAAAAK
jgi:hypothetical protein